MMFDQNTENLITEVKKIEKDIADLAARRYELNQKIKNQEKEQWIAKIKNLDINQNSYLLAINKKDNWPVLEHIQVFYNLSIDNDKTNIACLQLQYRCFEEDISLDVIHSNFSFQSFLRLMDNYLLYPMSKQEYAAVLSKLLYFSYNENDYYEVIQLLHNEPLND